MTEQQAITLARIVNGAWQHTGGGIHTVIMYKPNGNIVVFSGEAVIEYLDADAMAHGVSVAECILG